MYQKRLNAVAYIGLVISALYLTAQLFLLITGLGVFNYSSFLVFLFISVYSYFYFLLTEISKVYSNRSK